MRQLVTLTLVVFATAAVADSHSIEDKIQAAMATEIRGEGDVARDKNRKPVETLSFFQLRDDMRVMELLPGGGWYTKILAPVLRDNGELHLALGINRVQEQLSAEKGFDRLRFVETDVELVRDGEFGTRNVADFDFGVTDLDMVLTFRNMHNFTADGRASINNAVFRSLRAGGLYGVVDHNRRHMQPMTAENRRRVDVVDIIQEVQAAGFVLIDHSDLHYRPDDELRYEVGRKTVTGNTDRFTLLFCRQ